MAGKKIYILTVLLAIIFLFTIAFNFSSAFTGAERQALIESLVKQILIIKEKILEIQRQLLLLISNQAPIPTKQPTVILNMPVVLNSELNIQSNGVNNYDGYYDEFLKSLADIGFTQEEFDLIKKDSSGRPYSFEELVEQIIFGSDLENLRPSFEAWRNINERGVESLKKISVSNEMASFHKSLIVWYRYQSLFSDKLIKNDLTRTEIKNLYDQYLSNAKISAPKFSSIENSSFNKFFSFIPLAHAFAFYHFGGMVLSWADTCTTGIAISVGPPRGGLLWIYYSVWAANPYLWKNLSPGTYILGRALYGPGTCNKGTVTYPMGMAQILYFGSSPL